MGHRQELTRVMVKSISIANSASKTSSKTEVKTKSTKPKVSNLEN
jgi:large subunit ribosomal protein L21